MLTLPLTQNKVALISDEDYAALNQWKWTYLPNGRSGYAIRWETRDSRRRTIYMHRQIMDAPRGQLVDHEDGNGLNNQRHNLRLCNQSLNQVNRAAVARDIPYRGVYRETDRESYFAAIKFQGCMIRLGKFSRAELETAARIRDRAALHLFGSFARLNFPDEIEAIRALPVPAAIERRLTAPRQLALDLADTDDLPPFEVGKPDWAAMRALRAGRALLLPRPSGHLEDDLL